MNNVLILYSTTDGQTVKISQHIKSSLQDQRHKATVMPIKFAESVDWASFDKIVIAASIRYGKHRPEVAEFVTDNLALLTTKKTAFFTVNLVARKPNKNTPETNPYLIKFLAKLSWQPNLTGVFAGKIDYPKYGFLDRLMIRFIMLITKGPTDPTVVVEFTDWDKVEHFAQQIAEM